MTSLLKTDSHFLSIPMMLPKPGCDPLTRQKVLDDIEKIEDYQLKRRLKNRMSAQAARERKKARMDELERQLTILTERLRRSERENFCLRDRLVQYEPAEPVLFDQMNSYSQTFKHIADEAHQRTMFDRISPPNIRTGGGEDDVHRRWTPTQPGSSPTTLPINFNQLEYYQNFSPQIQQYLTLHDGSKNCSPPSSFYSE